MGYDEDWRAGFRATIQTRIKIAVGVSITWAVLDAVLFGSGLISDLRLFRAQGVAVFGVTTVKVFLFDIQGLGTVARTISFLVLGAILLAASYAYARR